MIMGKTLCVCVCVCVCCYCFSGEGCENGVCVLFKGLENLKEFHTLAQKFREMKIMMSIEFHLTCSYCFVL